MIRGTAIFDRFLGAEAAGALLDFALANEAGFRPSTIVGEDGNAVHAEARSSSTFRGDWGEQREIFAEAVRARVSEILAATGVPDWSPKHMQVDLAAHRDGDFFRTHTDTLTGKNRRDEVRMVSAVYYVHRQPRGFSGGELVIRDVRGQSENAIKPLHDRLVVFPSFLPHEVAPVEVPGDSFANARFSINCWLNRVRG